MGTEFEHKFQQRWMRLPHQLRSAIKDLHRAGRNIDLIRNARVIARQSLRNPLDQVLADTLIERRELPQVQRFVQEAL
ncbi:hypothetical protein [uncultured Microbulbifer sp.]|uniref:hypothetical protein n=1 Tax=uncultured Microbulbifer sp. TaxID=348147 RepID=UPI0025FB0B61|nr:hypothetical protein [uncultured Microbulbifer sp.]